MEACYKDFVCVENAKVMTLQNILESDQRYTLLGCAFFVTTILAWRLLNLSKHEWKCPARNNFHC